MDKSWYPLVAIMIFLAGLLSGYHLEIRLLPHVWRLGKTDGVICFALDSVMGDPTVGPHWLAKDGICYVEDLPH